MKCIYCNAVIEQDAQFCTNCGKDLSKFNKCVKCGELLEDDALFCPYCGTEQPKKDVTIEEKQDSPNELQQESMADTLQPDEAKKSKRGIWIIVAILLLCAIAGAGYYFFDKSSGNDSYVAASDTIAVDDSSAEYDTIAAKEFIESMYKDLYEPFELYDKRRYEKTLLSKYFTKEAMQKFYVESDYEEGDLGDFFYCTDFLVNGSISGSASPDYGYEVVSRTIKPESDDWFLVTNIWDVIQTPVKVHLKVKSADGELKIVDIKLDNEDQEEVVTAENLSDLISFAEILKTNGNFEELVSSHGFKSSVIDETSNYYKNCTVSNGKIVPTGEGSSILIRECLWPGKTYGYLTIEVFDDGDYKQLLSELESVYGSNFVNDHREFPAKWANGMDATFTIEGKASGGIFRLDEFYFE